MQRTWLLVNFNNQKPIAGVNGQEDKILLKELHRLKVRRVVLYTFSRVKGDAKYQLVLPTEFRKLALKCVHDDIGHLGRDRGIHVLRVKNEC